MKERRRVGAVDGTVVEGEGGRPTEWIPTASVPSGAVITTGRRLIPSVERIATCGWLMIGAVMNVPNGPGFVIVNVPPATSSADSFREQAPVGEVGHGAGDSPQRLALGVADDGDDGPALPQVHCDPEIDVPVDDEGVVADGPR